MRIHPPQICIDPNEPFKEALFGRKAFAESLTQLLRNVSESLVVIVHAPWGEGKSTFASMWQVELRRLKLDVIYFDAYAADYFEDPFVCFSGEILEFTKKRLPEDKGSGARSEFRKTAVEVGKRLTGLIAEIAIKAATLGALEAAHLKELKELSSEIASGIGKISAETIEKKIENYTAEKDSLAAFKKSLADLAKVVREEQGFPLTIIVDELDRCRPDFALSLLERIKHLFDVEGVAFVLLVNRDQIESYIKTVYGDVDAHAYLLKFGNLFVDLPHLQPEHELQYVKGRQDYCQTLIGHYELSKKVDNARFLADWLQVLVEHFNLTLREIERMFALLTLYFGSLSGDQFTNDFLVALLSILKVKRPQLYGRLRAGQVSVEAFFTDSKLDQIKKGSQRIGLNWAKQVLRVCLMSDAEYEEAVITEKNSKDPYSSLSGVRRQLPEDDRTKIIPLLCSRLDRFALKP